MDRIREDFAVGRYICSVCGYMYDEAEGAPDDDIPPGTRFEELPGDWACPACGASEEDFSEE